MAVQRFYVEVATKQVLLLLMIGPWLYANTFDSMRHMEQENQSAILAVVGLLMAAGIVGLFEATYQKTTLSNPIHRHLVHFTKLFLLIGISELMILALATIGTTHWLWDDPLLWALLPIYAALYVFDWWDALSAATRSPTGDAAEKQ
ncbi:hypothetical protein ACFOEK_17570 [Litoribrevibacter euphylliae]|uniref:Uncharacterized protein n=1 Tax=Litoribrevibacter euphylliae TaxID=1834034 RepID=A0ABV7HG38_9GAMM